MSIEDWHHDWMNFLGRDANESGLDQFGSLTFETLMDITYMDGRPSVSTRDMDAGRRSARIPSVLV